MGERLRKTGGEFGVTTGRVAADRLVRRGHRALRQRVNGITDYFLTKLDVLSGLERVPICVAYEVDGFRVTTCR